ncbi:MAG: DEAD/DEAH box helicase [FCB group bacterium]|nr:DEAD/DEAH box helicase [FCB group bacterium]
MNLDQRIDDTATESYGRRSKKTTGRSNSGFDNLGIASRLMTGVKRLNFQTPTPIQKEAIPVGLRGEDVIAIARTGSGKTLAYGIPLLQRLAEAKRGAGLILVPTRELALQVDESLRTLGHSVHIRSVVLIGGASLSMQRIALKRNPGIIIATPGRLMDHIERRTVNLSDIEVFILDEADRMLDMGFLPDIKKIMKSIPDQRQTMLFSATMPKEIEAIARQLMENPTRVESDCSGVTPTEISHEMFFITNRDKKRLLAVQLEECSGPVLVFTRTKRMAKTLTVNVNNMGFAAAEIHSNRSQGQRRQALEGFKRGRYQILIATDIAARGIDVTGIELVVNYDMPANSEDYVHRIGRTGRAGKTGHAISYATTAQKGSIRSLERFMKTKMAISNLPALPAEKFLSKRGAQSNSTSEPSRDEKPAKRKSSKDRSSKRKDFKPGEAKKFAKKRIDEKRNDSKQGESRKFSKKRIGAKRIDFKPGESKKFGKKRNEIKQKDFRKKDGNRQGLKRRNSKPHDSQPADFSLDYPFWTDFKKKRPGKKKPAGQGSPRKKRARRK